MVGFNDQTHGSRCYGLLKKSSHQDMFILIQALLTNGLLWFLQMEEPKFIQW